jgi:hypothetical protein
LENSGKHWGKTRKTLEKSRKTLGKTRSEKWPKTEKLMVRKHFRKTVGKLWKTQGKTEKEHWKTRKTVENTKKTLGKH